ncbi:hypothetical protein [Fluviicola sp.]|uniref:hypothetical protein n=1 Tax=Fluviicola sp. TaxID=1917219 RepID=UPI0031DFC007
MLVYGDLEFRFRNNHLEVVTLTFEQSGAQVPAQIDSEQFRPVANRSFHVIENLLKENDVAWKKDEIMSDLDQEVDVYITEHHVHLAFYKDVLTKIGVVYK